MKLLALIFCVAVFHLVKAQNGFVSYAYASASAVIGITNIKTDAAGDYWMAIKSGGTTYNDVLRFDGLVWTALQSPNCLVAGNTNNCLEIDAAGNLWLGSTNGLQKFDGSSWTVYNSSNSGISSDNVISLSCEGNNVWIGTLNGLSKFDGVGFSNYNKANSSIPSDTVRAVFAESANAVWLGHHKSLSFFNGATSFANYQYTSAYSVGVFISGITRMQNDLYVSTTGKGVMKFSGSVFTNLQAIAPPGANISATMSVPKIATGKNGSLLFNALNAIHYFKPGSFESYYYPLLPSAQGTQVSYNPVTNETAVATRNFNGVLRLMILDSSSYNGLGLGDGAVHQHNFKYLDINQVRAGVGNRGDKHWDFRNSQAYEVPKNSDSHAAFSSSLWIGGMDINGQLHLAAQSQRQGDGDFFPGPLDTINVSSDSLTAWKYDCVWKVNKDMIYFFQQAFAAGNVQNGSYVVPHDILTWPAHGSGNYARSLAPFVDVNGNGIYDPVNDGDYPQIKGDESVFTIYNDKLAAHSHSGGTSLGIEVHYEEYAFNCPTIADSLAAINYTTYQDYTIINRSSADFDSVYLGFFESNLLGHYGDNRSTVIPEDNCLLTFNVDDYDGFPGYGTKPPVQSLVFLDGPQASYADTLDNNHNGLTDEAGEKCLLTSVMRKIDWGPCDFGYMQEPEDFYGYLKAVFQDSTHLTDGAHGCEPGNSIYFMKTGFPFTWSGNVSSDAEYHYPASGPFKLAAGDTVHFTTAYVFTRDTSLPYLDSSGFYSDLFLKNQSDVRKVKQWYLNNNAPSCHQLFLGSGAGKEQKFSFEIFPNPVSTDFTIRSSSDLKRVEIYDLAGRIIYSANCNSETLLLDASQFTGGFYVVTCSDTYGNKTSGKLIVKR